MQNLNFYLNFRILGQIVSFLKVKKIISSELILHHATELKMNNFVQQIFFIPSTMYPYKYKDNKKKRLIKDSLGEAGVKKN